MEQGGGSERRFGGDPPLSWYATRPLDLPTPAADRRASRRQRLLDALACLALASLCFSLAIGEALYRTDFEFYSRRPLNAPTLQALVVNVFALAAAGFVVARLARRARRPRWRRLAAVAATATVVVALSSVRTAYPSLGGWTERIPVPVLLAMVVLALVLAAVSPRHASRSIRRVGVVVSVWAVLAVLSTLWMFLEIARVPSWRRAVPPPSLNATAPSLRRVVWIVFDDLDQRVTFEARFAGLALPELDRLRAESLYADAARAPAPTTDLSLPALITGRAIVSVAPVSVDDLELRFADAKPVRWSTQPHVFSRARALGYNTALVGWQLPYARVLAGSLNVAEWQPSIAYDQTRADTFGDALLRQWASLAPPVHVRRLFAERLSAVGDAALRTATDGRFGLVMLHLPLPGTPGVYDPAAGRLTTWSFTGPEAEYLANLELVDRFVGELRRGLERARLDDRTWIVLSAARPRPGAEGRVPFLVRAPEGEGPHLDDAFDTRATQDLVVAILRGSVLDADGAARLLVRHPAARPGAPRPGS